MCIRDRISNEVPTNSVDVEEEPKAEVQEEEDTEALDEMRERLRALQE